MTKNPNSGKKYTMKDMRLLELKYRWPKKIVSIPIIKMSKHQRKETILKSLWKRHQVIENGESTRIIFNYLAVTLVVTLVLQFLKVNKCQIRLLYPAKFSHKIEK